MQDIDWGNIRLLILDVDGTLYDQQKLRRRMFLDLLLHCLPRPARWTEIAILRSFRREVERNRETRVKDLDRAQYEWCSLKTGLPAEKIRSTVRYWMHERPLRYMGDCIFPGIKELFDGKPGVFLAVFSDYPAEEKLQSMGLKADLVITATHPQVNRLKPDPGGLLFIAGHFRLPAEACLYIGDRTETDMEAARRARIKFILADRKNIYKSGFYHQILNRLAG